ncbi:hypothetical protein MNBD_ALPHA04-661 [hydrothermal vent metagenome]|uniref:HIRAN domain-containing protein n=1 Tax=hydrothermal vent metagenome TaxID=652676 RepID=A0A3B0S6W3_9ZZZZ
MRKRIFDLAGESFDNPDGTSRQQALKQAYPSDQVFLERQPDNPHDSNAIFVTNQAGLGIGYISSSDSKVLAPILDSARLHRAQIHELRGGLEDYETIGCRIAIAFDKEKFRPVHDLREEQNQFEISKSGCLGFVPIFGLLPLVLFAF